VVQPFAVLNVLSVITLVFALSMAVPLCVSFFVTDGALFAFAQGMGITALAGFLLRAATRGMRRELQVRDGFLLVALGWVLMPAFGTLPLMLYLPHLSFTDAYFECVSGLTTTGATVLTGLDYLPDSINLWRCQLQWMGGMGIIVLAVAILPMLGVGGSQIFRAETPGPMKDTKLTPRITETAKGLWLIYALITVACALAMKWAGMDWLDAVMHAFATVSLGGLSSHDASYAHWDSPAIEAVTIVFMVLAGMNFSTHFLALRKRSVSVYRRDPEILPYLSVLFFSVLGIAIFLQVKGIYPDFATALRHAAFNVISVATTTGFATTDYNLWPVFAPVWMLFLCSFATCSGSTGAGIKMIRAEIMAKQALRELQRIIHPRAYSSLKVAGHSIENNVVFAILAFMLIYGASTIAMTMILAASGLDIVTAFSAIVACINNTGPGLGQIGPAGNFSVLNDFQIWVCAFAMLLGRLELFTLIVVITPAFWRQ
jgi:trk system potassium uptake protein TrkH